MGENNHKRTRSNRKTSEPHKPCMNLEDASWQKQRRHETIEKKEKLAAVKGNQGRKGV